MAKLFVVPTPIGNLEDFTFRAVRILEEVDLILAEDTRTSAKLMVHYQISTTMRSFHMHNEHKTIDKWIELLLDGKTIALITDAGTPAISDPGFLLIRECVKNNIEVAGLPCEKFIFEGFLPLKKGRQTLLKVLAEETKTMVFYESPYRIKKTLAQFVEYMGEDRNVSVSREISKKFEETIRGSLTEVLAYFETKKPKGEFVIVLEGK